MSTIARKISRLRQCRDFQRYPIRAVMGRLLWKLRWTLTSRPCHLRLGGEFDILAPKSGSGGFIFTYGYSEPETARFVMNFLKPGMVFWDIGAHLGEYALLASRSVGNAGRVEAFEPQPGIFELLAHNTGTNKLRNVTLHQSAVADCTGVATLTLHPDPSKSYLMSPDASQNGFTAIAVPTISLDDFYRSTGKIPQLIKVDVEGAEPLVLKGADSLLRLPSSIAPVWAIEYAPQNHEKFGNLPDTLLTTLHTYGYRIFWLTDIGELEPFAPLQH